MGTSKFSKFVWDVFALVRRFHPSATAVKIRRAMVAEKGGDPSVGSIYAALDRLEEDGLVESREEPGGQKRGYHPVKFYQLTNSGRKTPVPSKKRQAGILSGVRPTTESA
jgi:Fe2+ or Zn2+ uptake regulation protein